MKYLLSLNVATSSIPNSKLVHSTRLCISPCCAIQTYWICNFEKLYKILFIWKMEVKMHILDYNFEINRRKSYTKNYYFIHITNDSNLTVSL